MAESLIPEVIPGLVAVEYVGKDEKMKGAKNVYPIDAKELIASGEYRLVDNGAAEAARLNANPLRGKSRKVETEVTGIAGQVVETTESGGTTTAAAKAPGTPVGAKDDKK